MLNYHRDLSGDLWMPKYHRDLSGDLWMLSCLGLVIMVPIE